MKKFILITSLFMTCLSFGETDEAINTACSETSFGVIEQDCKTLKTPPEISRECAITTGANAIKHLCILGQVSIKVSNWCMKNSSTYSKQAMCLNSKLSYDELETCRKKSVNEDDKWSCIRNASNELKAKDPILDSCSKNSKYYLLKL